MRFRRWVSPISSKKARLLSFLFLGADGSGIWGGILNGVTGGSGSSGEVLSNSSSWIDLSFGKVDSSSSVKMAGCNLGYCSSGRVQQALFQGKGLLQTCKIRFLCAQEVQTIPSFPFWASLLKVRSTGTFPMQFVPTWYCSKRPLFLVLQARQSRLVVLSGHDSCVKKKNFFDRSQKSSKMQATHQGGYPQWLVWAGELMEGFFHFLFISFHFHRKKRIKEFEFSFKIRIFQFIGKISFWMRLRFKFAERHDEIVERFEFKVYH